MISLGRFRWLVVACAALGVVSFGLADSSPGLMLAALVVLGASAWITRPPNGLLVPQWIVNVVVVALGLSAVWTSLRGGPSVSGFARFLVWLTVLKVYDLRRPRDEGQVLVLSAFLGIAAMLTDIRLWVSLVVLAQASMLAWTAMRLHFAVGAKRIADAAALGVRRVGVLAPDAAPVRRSLRRTGAAMLVAMLGISVVVFVLVPRSGLGNRIGSFGAASLGRQTGFADEVVLGVGGLLSQSTLPVLDLRVAEVDLDGNEGSPIGGPGHIFHLRGAVLDHYKDGWWTASSGVPRGGNEVQPGGRMPVSVLPPLQDRVKADVTLRNARPGVTRLFSLWRPYWVSFTDKVRFDMHQWTSELFAETPGGRTRYSVECYLLDDLPDATFLRRYETADFPSERVRGLASEWLRAEGIEPDPNSRDVRDDGYAARVIESELRDRYTYTLDIPATPAGADPIEWFLFESKRGQCEYFASAMVAMCRSVGIDARVVTGYVAVEFNEASGHYIVRENDAHAWVEACIGCGPNATSQVWRTFDPTPPSVLYPSGDGRGVFARLSGLFEAAEYAWVRGVVGFDSSSQWALAGSRTPEWQLHARGDGGSSSPFGALLARVAFVGVAALVLGAVAWGGRAWITRRIERRRRLRALSTSDQQHDLRPTDVAFYADLLDRLRESGLAKPEWRAPLHHAGALRDEHPGVSETTDRVARAYYALRFGGLAISEQDRADLARAVAQVRA